MRKGLAIIWLCVLSMFIAAVAVAPAEAEQATGPEWVGACSYRVVGEAAENTWEGQGRAGEDEAGLAEHCKTEVTAALWREERGRKIDGACTACRWTSRPAPAAAYRCTGEVPCRRSADNKTSGCTFKDHPVNADSEPAARVQAHIDCARELVSKYGGTWSCMSTGMRCEKPN